MIGYRPDPFKLWMMDYVNDLNIIKLISGFCWIADELERGFVQCSLKFS